MIDTNTAALIRSATDTLAAVARNVGVSISTPDAHGHLQEQARAGPHASLAHLPPYSGDIADIPVVTVRPGADQSWYGVEIGLLGRDRNPLGRLRVVGPFQPTRKMLPLIESWARHAALLLEQGALHQELQHSFNQLFIVYEAGRLLNLSHSADEVMSLVVSLLGRTLHFDHCAVMILEGDRITPGAHAGLDPEWAASRRLPLAETYAARVLEMEASALFDDAGDLDGLSLPVLNTGQVPANLLCAPLTTRTGTLGFLEVYHATPEPFSDDEVFVVSALAVETAAALENARLYEALRDREERLTQYAAKLVNSQEEERRRISRDVHDGLGQMIVSALQYLQAHEYSLPDGHPREAFQHGMAILQQCVTETRRVMSDLRPSVLDDFGLVIALQQHLDAVAQEAGWQAQCEARGAVTRLSPAVETTIYRVVQEALTNARKHAASDRVHVGLSRESDTIVVEVRDWGRGFDLSDVAAKPDRGEHLGLMGMRERVSLLGGRVEIHSAPGAGTTVRIELPAA